MRRGWRERRFQSSTCAASNSSSALLRLPDFDYSESPNPLSKRLRLVTLLKLAFFFPFPPRFSFSGGGVHRRGTLRYVLFLFLFDGLVLLCCRLEGPVFALGRRADICMAAEKEDERQRRDVRVLRTE